MGRCEGEEKREVKGGGKGEGEGRGGGKRKGREKEERGREMRKKRIIKTCSCMHVCEDEFQILVLDSYPFTRLVGLPSLLSVDFLPWGSRRSGRDWARTIWGRGRSPRGLFTSSRLTSDISLVLLSLEL